MNDPAPQESLAERLERIEAELAALQRELRESQRKRKRRTAKRAVKVARRVRSEVVHEPSELDRARARQALRRMGRR